MKNRTPSLWLPVIATLTIAMSGPVWANPTGENVISGAADFNRAGSELTVTQHTQNAIVNWQDFSIGAGELTRFMQPQGGAILNRVVGDNPSSIYGTLQATGQVYLINQHGIVVGPNGVINATGGFVGSTLDVEDSNFINGGDLTFKGATPGPVKNMGTIKSSDGDVVLLGQEVRNEGEIKAGGDAVMAAGSALVLKPSGSNRVAVLAGSAAGTLENSGLVEGANAELLANGGNAGALAINTTGIVRATGVQQKDGRLILSGGEGDVTVAGELEAKRGTDGGDITVTGKRILVAENTTISADGNNGGKVKLGGGREGKDASVPNAERLYIAPTARVSANGTAGNGGEIIAYSTKGTQSYGTLVARGTANGGFIETSGGLLELGNNAPDVTGSLLAGTWLIDPYDIEIMAGGGTSGINASSPFTSNGNSSQLGVNLITTALGSGNVVITTGGGGTQAGDITLNTDLNFNGVGSNRTLTFNAHRNVTINNRIYDSAAGGDSLNVVLNADSDNNQLGAAIIRANISTGGGNLTSNRATYIAGSNALTLDSGAGNITFTGQVQLANDNGITLTTNGGTIQFSSALDSGNTYALDSNMRTWSNALTAVKVGTGGNVGDSYLATITSALENSIAQSVAGGNEAWLGGSDGAVEGQWRWVAGPEGLENGGAGRQFWQGTGGGSSVGGQYSNWNSGEPNDSSGNEDALQIGFGDAGEWNDYPANSSVIMAVVETNKAPTNLTVNLGTGGTLTLNGAVGAERQLGNLTVNSGGTVNINNNVTSAGTIDLDSAVAFNSANRTLTANSLVLRKAATGTANGNAWVADNMDLRAAIDFTGQNLRLAQRTNGRAINLISAGGGLELSQAELSRVTAQGLIIGNANSGNLTITDSINLPNINNLMLESGGTINDNAGATITANGLALRAGGAITLDNGHNVNALAIHNTAANSVFLGNTAYRIANFAGFADGITANGRNVALQGGGAVTQERAIVAAGLELLGVNGEWLLTHASNDIDTLSTNTKSVNYLDSNALSLGTVNGTVGINNTGSLQVRTASGNLSVDQNVTAGGGGNSLVLAAGAAFNNNRGANALNAGTGGRYLVYSSTPGATDLDGLTPGRLYTKTFSGNAPATIDFDGNWVLYNYTPILVFTAQNANHVYGSPNYTYTVTGFENGDSAASAFRGAPTFTPASANVGTHALNINSTGLTNLQGYQFNFVNAQTTITPAALTITADSFTREMNQLNPEFTATFAGLANGDTKNAISGLTLTTTAKPGSPLGTYDITAAGGTNSNYTITHVNGKLTVNHFQAAEKVIEHLQVITDMPTTQQNEQLKIVANAPEAAQQQGGQQGGSVKVAVRGTTMPQVAVETAALTKGGGSASGEVKGGGGVLAQTSTLDVISEEDEEEKR